MSALEQVFSNPMLDLSDASDLVDKLSEEGWRGEHMVAQQLFAALLNDLELDDEMRQALLFSDQHNTDEMR